MEPRRALESFNALGRTLEVPGHLIHQRLPRADLQIEAAGRNARLRQERRIGAPDHQRSPHHEDAGLAEAMVLQLERRGDVEDADEEAGERERRDRPPARRQ